MPRARSPARDKAKELWLKSNKQRSLKDIADELNVSDTQVRKWKKQDEWEPKTKGNDLKGTLPNTNSHVTKRKETVIVIENDELNDKQKLFCFYYLKYFNATKAYQKSYECDYMTAMANGSRLLSKAKIKQEIERLKQELFADTYVEIKAVLQKMIDIAFADIGDYLEFGQKTIDTADGRTLEVNSVKLKESRELDTSILTEVKQGREGVSIKLADKMKALEFLSKYEDRLTDNEKSKLQEEKLRLEVQKAQKELDELNGKEDEQVIFVDSTAEMEAYLAEHGDSNGEG